MRMRIAIIYNQTFPSLYDTAGENEAVVGVMDAVNAVHQALSELGHDVNLIPLLPPLDAAGQKLKELQADLVFNLFEGFCGCPQSEAEVAGILSETGIPYTGCPPNALKIALDKAKTKAILKNFGLKTPDFQLVRLDNLSSFHLNFPCIVKPRCEDASHGLSEESVVNDFASLQRQVKKMINLYGKEEALVEEFVNGREFNITLVGNSDAKALAISEIVFALPAGLPNILTYAAKWEQNSLYFKGTKAVCPTQISKVTQQQITEMAKAVFHLIGCRGYARVDMRLDEDEHPTIIEVNPNPDISPGAGATLQAKIAGMDYRQFIAQIISLALEPNTL